MYIVIKMYFKIKYIFFHLKKIEIQYYIKYNIMIRIFHYNYLLIYFYIILKKYIFLFKKNFSFASKFFLLN